MRGDTYNQKGGIFLKYKSRWMHASRSMDGTMQTMANELMDTNTRMQRCHVLEIQRQMDAYKHGSMDANR